MAKKQTGSRPRVATLPGQGVSAKLTDYLKEGRTSTPKPPIAKSKRR